MVIQYPHTGIVYQLGTSAQDGDGNWPEAASSIFLETICRAEVRTETQYIAGQNGDKIGFNCIVYMPIPGVNLQPGQIFEVWDGSRLIVTSDIKQFSKGQLNARSWL